MALETLRGIKKLGDFEVIVMDELRKRYPERFTETGAMDHTWFEETVRPHNFIYVRHDKNSISFTLQNGPVKAWGVNGCQVDALIEAAKAILDGLNKHFPCRENACAITKLDEALHWLEHRTKDRVKRQVEGTNQA